MLIARNRRKERMLVSVDWRRERVLVAVDRRREKMMLLGPGRGRGCLSAPSLYSIYELTD